MLHQSAVRFARWTDGLYRGRAAQAAICRPRGTRSRWQAVKRLARRAANCIRCSPATSTRRQSGWGCSPACRRSANRVRCSPACRRAANLCCSYISARRRAVPFSKTPATATSARSVCVRWYPSWFTLSPIDFR